MRIGKKNGELSQGYGKKMKNRMNERKGQSNNSGTHKFKWNEISQCGFCAPDGNLDP